METVKDATNTTERTNTILAFAKSKGKNEFSYLHSIVCLTIGWANKESMAMREYIDFSAIAKRMDEVMAETLL